MLHPRGTSVLSPYLCPFFCHSECWLLTNRAVGSSRHRGSGKTKEKLCAVQQQTVTTKASTHLCGRVLQGPQSWAESGLQQTHRGYYSLPRPPLSPGPVSVLGWHTADQESKPQALASASWPKIPPSVEGLLASSVRIPLMAHHGITLSNKWDNVVWRCLVHSSRVQYCDQSEQQQADPYFVWDFLFTLPQSLSRLLFCMGRVWQATLCTLRSASLGWSLLAV